MKILVLAKRFTSGKDSVKDNFGRAIRLFEQVSRKHEVTIIEADHIRKESFETRIGKMKIIVRPLSMPRLPSYYNLIRKKAASYDVIYATSHPLFGGIGLLAAKLAGKKFCYDIQDDYEAYTKNPAMRIMHNAATRNARLISCASAKLAEQTGSRNAVVILNGHDPAIAKHLDKKACRRKLKLSFKARIISYTGSTEFRAPDLLVSAFRKLQEKHKDIYLLMVGSSIKKKYASIGNDRIILLDSMPYDKLFTAINASDVMVMAYPSNRFTEAMQAPYKLAEYMACQKPIVLSDVGDMKLLAPRFVFKAGDEKDMIEKIEEALKFEKVDYGAKLKELTWQSLGKKLANAIERV